MFPVSLTIWYSFDAASISWKGCGWARTPIRTTCSAIGVTTWRPAGSVRSSTRPKLVTTPTWPAGITTTKVVTRAMNRATAPPMTKSRHAAAKGAGSTLAPPRPPHEGAGAFGDIGVFLPLALGLIAVNGMDPTLVFGLAGAYYLLTGRFYRLPLPVPPFKAVSALAIAGGAPAGAPAGAAPGVGGGGAPPAGGGPPPGGGAAGGGGRAPGAPPRGRNRRAGVPPPGGAPGGRAPRA